MGREVSRTNDFCRLLVLNTSMHNLTTGWVAMWYVAVAPFYVIRAQKLYSQPFPMNPSFRPPPPISDAIRQEIYNQFMTDPVENSVRKLAIRYTLAFKRVDAILRLKGLEHSWYKVGICFCRACLLDEPKRNYSISL